MAQRSCVREYPNVLAIDVGELLHQVRRIIEQVARAVEFVFLFTLAGGVLVLEAAIAATQDERLYDAAVLRTLARKPSAARRRRRLAEFLALGALAGLVAAGGATAIGLRAGRSGVPRSHFGWNPWLWAIGIVGGALGVAAAGWLGTRARCASRRSPCCASSASGAMRNQ